MANKRIYSLSAGTADTADLMIIDKSGNSEAEYLSLGDLVTFILEQLQYVQTIVDGTKNDQITHSLGSANVKAYLFDENGAEVPGWEYTIDDSNNITPNIGISLSGRGTWKIIIVKLRSS